LHFDREPARRVAKVRVRITEPLSGSIDGIQLSRFTKGSVYEVGTSIGCYLLSVGAAEPAIDHPLFATDGSLAAAALPVEQADDAPRRTRRRNK
jgi:hypothetical protein